MKMSSSTMTAAILGAGAAWLGLVATAAGWRWTSQTLAGPAWEDAWLYTNMTLAMCLFVLFPMMLASVTFAGGDNRRSCSFRSGLALLAAAVPMLITAAWLNQTSVPILMNVSAIQMAFAIFAVGLSMWSVEFHGTGRIVSLGAAAGLFLLPPGIALIQAANFPWLIGGLWGRWLTLFPAPIIQLACHSALNESTVGWIVGAYSVIGMTMFFHGIQWCEHRISP